MVGTNAKTGLKAGAVAGLGFSEVQTMSAVANDERLDVTGDTLKGVAAIAEFRGESERRTSYLLERGLIPGGQVGRIWYASKSTLREHHRRVVSGGAGQ